MGRLVFNERIATVKIYKHATAWAEARPYGMVGKAMKIIGNTIYGHTSGGPGTMEQTLRACALADQAYSRVMGPSQPLP